MSNNDCVFCQIVKGTAPCHEIWSDEKHMAFLSIFPNTEGFTVVIPKEHFSSYAFDQSDQVLSDLIIASKKVAKILDNYFTDSVRTGLFFEGWGVDHLHSKLTPMHGTGGVEKWANIESEKFKKYFNTYPGYLSSNDSERADDTKLAKLAANIKKSYS